MMFEEENDDIVEYTSSINENYVIAQKRLQSYKLLFNYWYSLGKNSPLYIYKYFGEKHTLDKMLNVFINEEMYEECIIIRDWMTEINSFTQKNLEIF